MSSKTITMAPYAVIAPTPINSDFFFAGNGSDGCMGLVLEHNQTTDPTFIPAQELFP